MSVDAAAAPTVAAGSVARGTTLELFLRQAERFGDRTLLRTYDEASSAWRATSWNEFRDGVIRVAEGLVRLGVNPTDRVLLLSENRAEWLFCDLGIQAVGAITVPVYASLVPASVASIAEDSGAAVAIVSGDHQAAKLAGMTSPPRIVTMERDVPAWLADLEDAESSEVGSRIRNLRPDHVATIAYTSGTTGHPKGAVITHATVVAEVESYMKAYDIGPDDVMLSVVPYAHILARMAEFYFAALGAGGQLNLGRGPQYFLEDVQAVRPTCMDAVPLLFERLTKRVSTQMRERSSLVRALFEWSIQVGRDRVRARSASPWLRLQHAVAERLMLRRVREMITGGRLRFYLSGGAPLTPTVEEFFWAIGVPIYQGWGMTELTCGATCNTIAEHRFGTVGKPLPGVEIRLAVDGEIEVRSPGAMKEYYRNPSATAETIVDGWIRTGDIGRIDEDGYLTITDRKKDLIKTLGGKYVAPQPIEVQLQQDPHIQTAVVVGDGRKYATALIVPDWPLVTKELNLSKPPEQLVRDQRVMSMVQKRVDEVNAHLDRFEAVQYFRLLARPLTIEADEITASYKIKRRIVHEHYRALVDEMYATAAAA